MANKIWTSYSIENDREFARVLARAQKEVIDLSIPLNLIRRDFHRSQKAIFQLKGPGGYPDFSSQKSIESKERKLVKIGRSKGDIYPLLFLTGRLAKSTTDPNSRDAISVVRNKKDLFIGTKVPYAVYHQSDFETAGIGRKIPQRKFLFIGPEAQREAVGATAGRLSRWKNILQKHVQNAMKEINSGGNNGL